MVQRTVKINVCLVEQLASYEEYFLRYAYINKNKLQELINVGYIRGNRDK